MKRSHPPLLPFVLLVSASLAAQPVPILTEITDEVSLEFVHDAGESGLKRTPVIGEFLTEVAGEATAALFFEKLHRPCLKERFQTAQRTAISLDEIVPQIFTLAFTVELKNA